jgi:iron complex outermembrane receptor protein
MASMQRGYAATAQRGANARLPRNGLLGIVIAIAVAPSDTLAQRAAQNATTESGDAFGRQVGTESTGLYSDNDVRGFSPVDAGNARVEGLYYDQLDDFPESILNGSAIRVGLSTQGYFFPAPTGIVDYEILRPADTFRGNVRLVYGSHATKRVLGEIRSPVVPGELGIAGGFQANYRNFYDGGEGKSVNYGMVAQWRPYGNANVVLMAGGNRSWDEDTGPEIFVNGDYLPPRIKRGRELGQSWNKKESTSSLFGALARLPLSERYRLEVSAFRNRQVGSSASDIMSGVAEDGHVARRTIIMDRDRPRSAYSGEVRLVRAWQGGGIVHRLAASARLRRQHRQFGGAHRHDLGESTILAPDLRPAPEYLIEERSTDRVRQLTYGLAYSAVMGDAATFDAGISRSDYDKFVDFVNPAVADAETIDKPILWNLSGSVHILPELTAYAGVTRGLEDASIAPDFAVNRDVAPPAIRTRQEDASLRWEVTQDLSVILGAFRISKPYYNLDAVNQYRLLGEVSMQGVELSFAGQLFPGMSVVLGTVLMDPEISGEIVKSGVLGPRPVGSTRRKSVANLDWRLQEGTGALSFDLAVESNSKRVANALNTFSAPASLVVDLGARYRFDAYGLNMVLRPRLYNVFNQYVWRVSSGGAYRYSDRRRVSVELLADF